MRSSGQTSNRTLSSHNAGALLGARIKWLTKRGPTTETQILKCRTLISFHVPSTLGLAELYGATPSMSWGAPNELSDAVRELRAFHYFSDSGLRTGVQLDPPVSQ